MKKVIPLLLLLLFLASCGPKRMSWYGKRCVSVGVKSNDTANKKYKTAS